MPIPGWQVVDVAVYFVPGAAGTGNVSLLAQISAFAPGETTNTGSFYSTAAVQGAAGGRDVMTMVTIPAVPLSSIIGKTGILRIKREQASPDTFAGAAVLSHIVISRVN